MSTHVPTDDRHVLKAKPDGSALEEDRSGDWGLFLVSGAGFLQPK